jgi:hypothetical protein
MHCLSIQYHSHSKAKERVGLVKFWEVFWVLKKVKIENWFVGGHIWECIFGQQKKIPLVKLFGLLLKNKKEKSIGKIFWSASEKQKIEVFSKIIIKKTIGVRLHNGGHARRSWRGIVGLLDGSGRHCRADKLWPLLVVPSLASIFNFNFFFFLNMQQGSLLTWKENIHT